MTFSRLASGSVEASPISAITDTGTARTTSSIGRGARKYLLHSLDAFLPSPDFADIADGARSSILFSNASLSIADKRGVFFDNSLLHERCNLSLRNLFSQMRGPEIHDLTPDLAVSQGTPPRSTAAFSGPSFTGAGEDSAKTPIPLQAALFVFPATSTPGSLAGMRFLRRSAGPLVCGSHSTPAARYCRKSCPSAGACSFVVSGSGITQRG